MKLTDYRWDNYQAANLVRQLQAIPTIVQQSAKEIAPHLVIHHLELISDLFHKWSESLTPTLSDCVLLLTTRQRIFVLLETVFEISVPE